MILKTTKSLEAEYKKLFDKIVEDSFNYDDSLESYTLMEKEWNLFYKMKKALEKRNKNYSYYIPYDGKPIYVCNYYPIKFKINEELLSTLTEKKDYYTQEEIDTLLRWTVNNTRDNLVKHSNKDIENLDVMGLCGIAQYSSIRPFEKIGLKVTYNNVGQMVKWCRHAFGTVTFPTIEGDKTYLIDTTYAQFFKLENNVKNFFDLRPGYYMIQSPITKAFAEELLNQGYVEATEENIMKYAYGFMMQEGLTYADTKSIAKSETDIQDCTDEELYRDGFILYLDEHTKKKH